MNRQFRDPKSEEDATPGLRDNSAASSLGCPEISVVESHQRAKTKVVIAVTACIILVSLLGAYFFILPSSVSAYVVTREPAAVEMAGPGILDATNKVVITSRIPGFLNSIHVDRNDSVAAGQILAELDARDIHSQLEGALADVEAAKSAVAEAKGNRAKAKAQLDKAKSDLRRRSGLSAGVVSAVEIENLEINARQAQAEYERSSAVEQGAVARVAVATAQVGVLLHKKDEAQIRSPLHGIVVSRDRSVGDLLGAGAQLFQIVDPRSIVIATRLDESIMSLIEPGQSARVRFTSDASQTIDAKVLRVSRVVDPETREFIVELMPDGLPRNWALGQRAHVAITSFLPPRIAIIPLAFVARHDGRAGVWRPVAGRATWTPVELGNASGSYVQVLQGITPGDLILEPQGRYRFEAVAIKGASQ